MRRVLLTSLAALLGGAAAAATPVDRLNVALLATDSATAVLQTICDTRGGGRIRARQAANRPEPGPPASVRAALRPTGGEPVQYRRVELTCGGEILSRADNWYLPARLTPEMNRTLAASETPFGVAVGGMGFRRRTLSVEKLRTGEGVLRHRAVLIGRDGRPFSLVQETYARAALQPGS
jgi:hypothetical protein